MGQTWQDVTLSRAWRTPYTNTTGRSIAVVVRAAINVSSEALFYINGSVVSQFGTGGAASLGYSHSVIVPPGATYMATYTGSAQPIQRWLELR